MTLLLTADTQLFWAISWIVPTLVAGGTVGWLRVSVCRRVSSSRFLVVRVAGGVPVLGLAGARWVRVRSPGGGRVAAAVCGSWGDVKGLSGVSGVVVNGVPVAIVDC